MTETLAHGYSSESTQRELCNEYQRDRVQMVFKNICVIMLALTMLEIYYLQTFFLESIWSRNGDQMPYTNSPSNILWTFALLPSYFQKYESSRLYFPEELEVSIG